MPLTISRQAIQTINQIIQGRRRALFERAGTGLTDGIACPRGASRIIGKGPVGISGGISKTTDVSRLGVSKISATATFEPVNEGGTGVIGSGIGEAGMACNGGKVVDSASDSGAGVSGMRGKTSVGWAADRFTSTRQPLRRATEASAGGISSRAAFRYVPASEPTSCPHLLQ